MIKTKDTKQILSKIRRLEIKTSKIVNDIFAGQYSSVFKGRGMEFAEVREYEVGDDIRSIDWNVSARTGKPYIKKYIEERELTVVIMVDMSRSLAFGSIEKFKVEILAEVSAILAFSAIKNNDKVGLLIFTDEIEKFIPPTKGRQHILRMIREILYFEPKNHGTNIKLALEYFNDIIKRKSVVFLLSDFCVGGYEKAIKVVNKKHDLINIKISDNREIEIPKLGYVTLKDNETGDMLEFDSSNKNFRQKFEKNLKDKNEYFDNFCKKNALQLINIKTDDSYIEPLIRFFKTRH
jgi:uncharacterized protein (DUF58 family)